MMKKKVSVVILNWNGRQHLERFLPGVIASTYGNLEVVVGDNGSTDDSVTMLQEHFPSVRIIETGVNLGFAGGYNNVLEMISSDYLLLLNSDVEVTPGWIEPLVELMDADPAIAACQPKVRSLKHPERFEHAGAAGGFIDYFGYPFCRGRILNETEVDNNQYADSTEIFWATGAAFMIRKDDWNRMGGFDADFFAHMEEIDLCWRLRRSGKKICYCAGSLVYHLGGGTLATENPYKTYLNFRNNLFMLQKNLPFWHAVGIISVRFWLDLFALLRFLTEGKRKEAAAVSKAHRNFLRNFTKTAKKRRTLALPFSFPLTGLYRGSVMWDFFINKQHRFSGLSAGRFVKKK